MPPMRAVRKLHALGETPIRAKWVIPAYIAIFAIAWGLYVANTTYARDKLAETELALSSARYTNAMADWDTCVRRVESRTEIRGMFAATLDVIDDLNADEPSPAIQAVRLRLDERYPAISLGSCGPMPGAPPGVPVVASTSDVPIPTTTTAP
jgi:hypothetical protein